MNILLEEKINGEGQNRLNIYLKQVLYLENSNLFPTGVNFLNLSLTKVFIEQTYIQKEELPVIW